MPYNPYYLLLYGVVYLKGRINLKVIHHGGPYKRIKDMMKVVLMIFLKRMYLWKRSDFKNKLFVTRK